MRYVWIGIAFVLLIAAVFLLRDTVDAHTGQPSFLFKLLFGSSVFLFSLSLVIWMLEYTGLKGRAEARAHPWLSYSIAFRKFRYLVTFLVTFLLGAVIHSTFIPSREKVAAENLVSVIDRIDQEIRKTGKAPADIALILNEFQEAVAGDNAFTVKGIKLKRMKNRKLYYFHKSDTYAVAYDMCFAMFAVSNHYCFNSADRS